MIAVKLPDFVETARELVAEPSPPWAEEVKELAAGAQEGQQAEIVEMMVAGLVY